MIGKLLLNRGNRNLVVHFCLVKQVLFERKMSADLAEGVLLPEVVKRLCNFASIKLAENWDNVGLLVEPSGCHKVKKILLTNDLTQAVLEEAVDKSTSMIISYHPPIFAPIKRLRQGNWKERIIVKAIESRIAIYSPHTGFDAVRGGVNDWLINCFGSGDVQPITQSMDVDISQGKLNGCYKMSFKFIDDGDEGLDYLIRVLKEMDETVTVNAAMQSDESFLLEVSVIPSEKAIAKVYNEIVGKDYDITATQAQISKLDQLPLLGYGMGRIVQLNEAISIQDAVEKVKEHLEIQHVRLALARKASKQKKVKSIAVCAGSGGSVLKGVSADLYVTGEMSHHEVLHATESGRSVILCEHSNTERGFLKTIIPMMNEWFNGEISIEVSKFDKDPLTVV